MTASPITTGWHRITDHHGARVVWVEPGRPREGWVACWPSRQAAERGNLLDALLLRTDAFAAIAESTAAGASSCG